MTRIIAIAAVLGLHVLSGCRADNACRGDFSCGVGAALLFSRLDRYFLYVPVASGLSTDIYRFNAETGAVSLVTGSTFANTISSVPDPLGKFMYGLVFAAAPNNVKPYKLDTYTGLLDSSSSVSGSANNQPAYARIHPNGQFLYVANYQSLDVSVFSMDQTTGNLTKIADTPTACGCVNLSQIDVTPNGRFAYITNNGGASHIVALSISQVTGAVSVIGNVNGAAGTDGIVVDPTSSYVYAVSNAGTIAGYAINSSTGALTALPGSPYAGTAGNYRMAMHPSGRYLYTVNIAGGLLAKHDIASNGSLSSAQTLAIGTNLQYVAIDPTGKFGFINDGVTSNFYIFSINQNNGTPSLAATIASSTIAGNLRIVRTNGWL